jgi:hypothetical protein
MSNLNTSQARTVLDLARVGRPLVDRFEMSWWLVEHGGDPLFVSAASPEAAAKATKNGTVCYSDLQATCGPLRAGARSA